MLPLEARLRLKWQGERAEFCRNGRQTKPGHATKWRPPTPIFLCPIGHKGAFTRTSKTQLDITTFIENNHTDHVRATLPVLKELVDVEILSIMCHFDQGFGWNKLL
jgi:hypothetical protein